MNRENGTVRLCVRCDGELDALLSRISAAENVSKSELVRRFVEAGLKDEGFKPDDERLREMVKAALSEVLKPHVERLASISAKSTQISAASFFMAAYIGSLVNGPGAIEEIASRARQLGIEYLKLKPGQDLDEFIQRGVKQPLDMD